MKRDFLKFDEAAERLDADVETVRQILLKNELSAYLELGRDCIAGYESGGFDPPVDGGNRHAEWRRQTETEGEGWWYIEGWFRVMPDSLKPALRSGGFANVFGMPNVEIWPWALPQQEFAEYKAFEYFTLYDVDETPKYPEINDLWLEADEVDSLAAKAVAKPIASNAGSWPWGEHETDLLRQLAAAAERFWRRYDPTDATTAPKNDEVVAWLKSRGVAERNAAVMATILRADKLPTGPRK